MNTRSRANGDTGASRPPLAFPESSTRGLFLSLVLVLLGLGVLMVHSASVTSWPTEFEHVYLSRHLVFLALGVAAAAVCAWLPSRFWHAAGPWMLFGCIGLLVLVLIPGVGTRVNGAQRWLRYGPASLQPSEIAKLALPLVLARLICSRRDRLSHLIKGTVPLLLPIAAVVPLVLLQPDLGTAAFLLGGCVLVLFVGGWPIRNFVISGLLLAVALSFVALKPYQMRRITGFMAALTDVNEAPYQLKQSLVTLGAGGTFGVGLGKGWQKLSFLPEANTDFVFAVIGEELGLVGTLGLAALWTGLYISGLRLLRPRERTSFAWLAGFTLLTQLVMQAALNVAVVVGVVPPKGIPHPLISYGGSNLVVSIVAVGIIVSLSRTDSDAAEAQLPEPALETFRPSIGREAA